MATHIEDLPDELLLRILDQLPESDLIASAPYVCVRWRRLSLDFQLWRNRACIEWWDSDSSAKRFYRKGPALRSVEFRRAVGGAVLRCLGSHCPTITSLNLFCTQRMSLRTLRAITRNCDQIRNLHINSEVLSCRRRAREVALMPRLETLAFQYWQPYEPMKLSELASGCPALRRLELPMADVCLTDLGVPLLRRLRGLVITWNSVSRDIGHCAENLEDLKLNDYDVCERPDTALAEELLPLKALTTVDASFISSNKVVRSLIQPSLRSLTLPSCTALDDNVLLHICRQCPLLEDLDIGFSDLLTARGLSSLWRLRRLRRLCISNCNALGSGAAEHLARCDALRDLNLDGVDLQSLEPGVSRLLELRKMRVLVVRAWTAKDLIPWESLPRAFPELEVLELGEWKSLDTALPEALDAAMPAARVTWHVSYDLFEREDYAPEDEICSLAAESEVEEEDMDLFVFYKD